MRLTMLLALLLLVSVPLSGRPLRAFRENNDENDNDDEEQSPSRRRNYLPESISNLIKSLYTNLIYTAVNARKIRETNIRPTRLSHEFHGSKSFSSMQRHKFPGPHILPRPPLLRGLPPRRAESTLISLLKTIIRHQSMQKPRPIIIAPPPPLLHHVSESTKYRASSVNNQQTSQQCMLPQNTGSNQQVGQQQQQANTPSSGRMGEPSSVVNPVPEIQPVQPTAPRQVEQPVTQPPQQPQNNIVQQQVQAPSTATLDMVAQALLRALPKPVTPQPIQPTIDVSSLLSVFKEQQHQLEELQEIQRAHKEQARLIGQARLEEKLKDLLQTQMKEQLASQAQAQALNFAQAQAETKLLAQALAQMQNSVVQQPINTHSSSSISFQNPQSNSAGAGGTGRAVVPDGGAQKPIQQPTVVHFNPTTIVDINKLMGQMNGHKLGSGGLCKTQECMQRVTHVTKTMGNHGQGKFFF